MSYYYVQDGERRGPIPRERLNQLVEEGTLPADVLIWSEGMSEWAPYPGAQAPEESPSLGGLTCSVCSRSFPMDDVIRIQGSTVCATCKPTFMQRIREGASVPGAVEYGGFWLRFAAKFIDWLFFYVIQTALNFLLVPLIISAGTNESAMILAMLLMLLASYGVMFLYNTLFIGRFAATPGKMLCQLRVVTSEGGRVTYLRAFARSVAEVVSAAIMLIGYIIAAFDKEKRTLHDRMCDTRVIKRR
jgi:uncharacterized RDD family membrane protein YckC